MSATIEILEIYLSPAHVYVGHHGRAPGVEPMILVEEAECVAEKGLVGDRYFGHRLDYKGQITFFSREVFDELAESIPVGEEAAPSSTRRNVIVRGVDLNALIGKAFGFGGLRFEGTEECRPCYWMNQAVGDGAEERMQGQGGLRARILQGGILRPGTYPLEID
jgi:MOSC domain-containing protein YiiM